jgi:hypothetical protein
MENPLVVIVVISPCYSKNEKRMSEQKERRKSVELFIFPEADI